MSFIKIIISFVFIVLPMLLPASEFSLSEINEQEYVLSSPNDESVKVIADRQASRELELIAVLHVKCAATATTEYLFYEVFLNQKLVVQNT